MGGKGSREESKEAIADSKLEVRKEVFLGGNILSVTEKVREEGNSCEAEMNVQAKPLWLKLCANNWQVGMPSSRDAIK